MGEAKLYKYLDANGGVMMLYYSDLQFTNATRLNDPFDCHPSLIDFSKVPAEKAKVWGKDGVIALESNRYERLRDETWVCSLSKVHDSLLMWSYYGNHKGVCIGLDMEKANKFLSKIYCSIYIGAMEMEVQYKDIIEKPDFFRDAKDYFHYQLATKAKAWEHEQEVRLLLINPSHVFITMSLPYEPKDKDKPIDWKEVRAYPTLGGECFKSVYLGINMNEQDREKVIKAAKKCNPDIKIYQMTVDPEAFRLKGELIKD